MRVKTADSICGVPAVALRDALRRAGRSDAWTVDFLRQLLDLSARRAQQLVRELAESGYIERESKRSDNLIWWRLTAKARALSLASAAKPITRATADRVVRDVIARADAINKSDDLVFLVSEMVAFGSYLGNIDRLGDVDIGFRLARRRPESSPLAENKNRVAAARSRGRVFPSLFAELTWDRTEVLLLLKARSRALSLHDMDDDAIFRGELAVRVIYRL
jgi:hypothetical protein